MKKILLLLTAALLLSVSCSEEQFSDSVFIDPDPALKTAFDHWLDRNYVDPYNIAFKYKTEDIESDMSFDLAPASTDKAIAMAKLIKHLWMEVYDQTINIAFTKRLIPKVIHLVGSPAYNTNNTMVLGTAEGGMKVTLYNINSIDPLTVTLTQLTDRYLKTMYHEFAHIMHQTYEYPTEYAAISNLDYVGNDWSVASATEAIAYELGFVSRYARSEPNEDFVEILSIYVTRGQANWDNILAQAGESGSAKLIQKLGLVKEYCVNVWGFELDFLRSNFESRAATLHTLDLLNL
ncbi:MAG: putative zinc-binding metallopeptidase [Bacteroidales bacterium]|nr:putative zinc-binding metallopeptidase [Bacteroidales bacterium]MCL2132940.1 putative zinc-binding metallopeptidase [Bacteroidales bacterium]